MSTNGNGDFEGSGKASGSGWSRLWERPKKWFLFGIPLGGFAMFLAGILFWGGLHWSVEATNSLEFCTSCHAMETYTFPEYQESNHYRNASGVRAVCADCHVPNAWAPKMIRKVEATFRELPAHFMGTISTEEKYEARRREMAERVWATMRANDSRECRDCHVYDAMDLEKQDRRASRRHSAEWLERTGDTCIDCHQGIAHELPELDLEF